MEILRNNKKKNLRINSEVFSQSFWVMKLYNKLMLSGKKTRVEKIILSCLYNFRQKHNDVVPMFILFKYLIKHRPMFDFNRIRKSRVFKRFPIPINPTRQLTLILTWFVSGMRAIKLGKLIQKFSRELKNMHLGSQKTGLVEYKFFQEYHYQITVNRVNLRFRWK